MLKKEELVGKYRGIFDCDTGEENDIVEFYIEDNELKGKSTGSSGYEYTLSCLYIDDNIIVMSYTRSTSSTTEVKEAMLIGHCILKQVEKENLDGIFINPYPYEHIDKNCGNYKLTKI